MKFDSKLDGPKLNQHNFWTLPNQISKQMKIKWNGKMNEKLLLGQYYNNAKKLSKESDSNWTKNETKQQKKLRALLEMNGITVLRRNGGKKSASRKKTCSQSQRKLHNIRKQTVNWIFFFFFCSPRLTRTSLHCIKTNS